MSQPASLEDARTGRAPTLEEHLEAQLDEVRHAGLYRSFRVIDGPHDTEVLLEDPAAGVRRNALLFCSNNYLGLANHPALKEAAARAAAEFGVGSGASRHICGTHAPHRDLEERLAAFEHCERAIVYNTGYMANVGIISALMDKDGAVFSDALNHASIIDGCRLSGAHKYVYRHADLDHLEELLRRSKARNKLIVTDSVFSMDGNLAPLPQIVALAKRYGAWTMVDEAHATGCLGESGRGVIEHYGLGGQVDVIMGTLGKGLGSFGAFAAGSSRLIEHLINRSRMLIFTTALPAPVLAATAAALDIVAREPERRKRLREAAERLRSGLRQLGFSTLESSTQIIPVVIGEPEPTMTFARRLLEEGVFVTGIRPPTVPPGTCRLRTTVMATHTDEQLGRALAAFEKVGRELGIV